MSPRQRSRRRASPGSPKSSRRPAPRTRAHEPETVTAVGWYRREQWPRLVEVSVDREDLEATYDDWLPEAEKFVNRMRRLGMAVEKVEMDVEELLAWCRQQGRFVDADARATYAAVLLQRRLLPPS